MKVVRNNILFWAGALCLSFGGIVLLMLFQIAYSEVRFGSGLNLDSEILWILVAAFSVGTLFTLSGILILLKLKFARRCFNFAMGVTILIVLIFFFNTIADELNYSYKSFDLVVVYLFFQLMWILIVISLILNNERIIPLYSKDAPFSFEDKDILDLDD